MEDNVEDLKAPAACLDDSSLSTPSDKSKFSDDKARLKMKRVMGLHHAISVIMGIVIGSGIFISPQGVLQQTGSIGTALLIWIGCGIFATLGSACYAELGTMIKHSGADYAYIRVAFGPMTSFLYLWVALVVILPCATAIVSITFANYVLKPFLPDCIAPDAAVRLLASVLLLLLTGLNCRNVSWANNVQVVFTVAKVFALLGIIVIGFMQLVKTGGTLLQEPFDGASVKPGSYALAFYSGIFSYAGWNSLCYVTEEIKNPFKNLPRAIWISLPLVTFIYVLANLAYMSVLTPAEMIASNAVAFAFGEKTVKIISWLMPIFVGVSAIGGVNGCLYVAPRLFFVGARNGHLPKLLSLLNIYYFTPIPSILIFCGFTLFYVFSGADVIQLITYMSFVETMFTGISVAGLLFLRWTQPNTPRPIRVNLAIPVIFMTIMLFVLIFSLTQDSTECFIGLCITLSGIPVYLFGVVWRNKPTPFKKAIVYVTVFTQKLCIASAEEKDLDD